VDNYLPMTQGCGILRGLLTGPGSEQAGRLAGWGGWLGRLWHIAYARAWVGAHAAPREVACVRRQRAGEPDPW